MCDETRLSREIGQLLVTNGLWLASAESCTGGLLGDIITNTAGSSEYFLGGFITYSNEAKRIFLGVNAATLTEYGAVSKEVVVEMAKSVRLAFRGDPMREKIIGVSISGIAGPGGGSMDKPVGTVWIAVSGEKEEDADCYHFSGSRTEIKRQSALQALKNLFRFVS